MAYYRQPEFYRSFHCMGGSCPNTCCANWRIDWTKEEVEKLKAADCSPEMRKLIDESFEPLPDNEKVMKIKFSGNNLKCPFLTDDKLCQIQRELGEEYLSYTCKVYPRAYFFSDNIVTRTCSASCFQVMKTICIEPDSMNLVSAPIESSATFLSSNADSSEAIKKHPELKYRNALFEFFYNIISNKKRSLETSIVLGALAAQKLTEYINSGEHDRIPEVIKAISPQLNAQTVPSFEQVKPNYGLSLGLTGELVNTFSGLNSLDILKEDGKLSVEKYEQGRVIFSSFTEKNPYLLRNIALNFLIEGKQPFMDKERSLFENYCYFASTVAAVKVLGAAAAYQNKSVKGAFFLIVSFFVRGMYHSPITTSPKIYEILKKNDISTPAKIALIIK